uniref:Uncharacterized protein n=1 Tax=Romanomermis culicivorax TaxID=13658 RepID=A0A915KQX9_ROMCU
ENSHKKSRDHRSRSHKHHDRHEEDRQRDHRREMRNANERKPNPIAFSTIFRSRGPIARSKSKSTAPSLGQK